MNPRVVWIGGLAFIALVLGVRFIDRPYTSSFLIPDGEGSARTPDQTGFWIGARRINLATYTNEASLTKFRSVFVAECPTDREAFEQALCISSQMAKRFAHGQPNNEFVAKTYDPVDDLVMHLEGQPGHCVTRAGLAATALLSRGVMARALQLITTDGVGHNVFEVWTATNGWVIVDPTYGHVSYRPRAGAPYQLEKRGSTPKGIEASFLDRPGALNGMFVYPDPWLYTRTGSSWTPWPFRGSFVIGGAMGMRFLSTHWTLLIFTLLSSIIAFGLVLQLFVQRRARRDVDA